ncbi:DnaD domain-containing protein [Bacillus sp. B1-b2]|uniref:DnaD domain-containing protein n=1 Tax=Bacillus sp. B1-b2 TaxID=2653201 RepID=UPI00126213C9|nr:DnaD domain protein [Bacillus sp. B1-b2]KAB7668742.1 DnaD domain protein [Bacillus sp. B1-b2]
MKSRTKKVVIKEELVELTGDYKLAIVLNQMMYWSERITDFDLFIQEEKECLAHNSMEPNLEHKHGWIYKSAAELAEECMITNSEATMRRYLQKLVEMNWLITRTNPKFRWDKTIQYRLNLMKIQEDLVSLGYDLEGSRLAIDLSETKMKSSNFQNESFHFHDERAIPKSTSNILKEEVNKQVSMNPFHFFEQNGFGIIAGHISQKIQMWCEDLSEELVLKAMEIAVERGAKTFSYVDTILRNWAEKKVNSVEEVHTLMQVYQDNKAHQRRSNQKKIMRKEIIPDYMRKPNYHEVKEKSIGNQQDMEMKRWDIERRIAAFRNG